MEGRLSGGGGGGAHADRNEIDLEVDSRWWNVIEAVFMDRYSEADLSGSDIHESGFPEGQ